MVLRQVLALLNRRERWRLFGVLCLTVVMGFVQMVGVASIMPFMAIVANPERVTTSRWFAPLYDALGFTDTHHFLLFAGAAVLAIMVFGNALKAFTTWSLLRFSWTLHFSVSQRLLARYLAEPYQFFLDRNSSKLAKNILAEVKEVVSGVIVPGLNMIAHGFVTVSILALVIAVNPVVAAAAAALFGGAFGVLHLAVRRRQLRLGRVRNRAHAARYRVAFEALAGIKDTKVLGREREFLARYERPARDYARANASNSAMSELPKYGLETMAFGGIVVLVLYLIGTHSDLAGALPVLSLYALASYRLMPSLQQVFKAVAKVRFYTPAVENLHDDLVGGEVPVAAPDDGTTIPFEREIHVDAVRFRYPGRDQPVLRDLSLTIPRNATVGFVGSSGSGKTTLVDVLLGLLEPESGCVRIDGVPLTRENMRAWRRRIGYVPQSIFLSDDTLAANIAFGLPPQLIDHEAVERAARAASLDELVRSLPEGFDTVVGDRGVRLSGGQRQRIGIARALYHDPDVLFLDEATSALDNLTEDAVMSAIHSLAGQKTIILVAHRLSTLRECDSIFVFDTGCVGSVGTYEELSKTSPGFRKLARLPEESAAAV